MMRKGDGRRSSRCCCTRWRTRACSSQVETDWNEQLASFVGRGAEQYIAPAMAKDPALMAELAHTLRGAADRGIDRRGHRGARRRSTPRACRTLQLLREREPVFAPVGRGAPAARTRRPRRRSCGSTMRACFSIGVIRARRAARAALGRGGRQLGALLAPCERYGAELWLNCDGRPLPRWLAVRRGARRGRHLHALRGRVFTAAPSTVRLERCSRPTRRATTRARANPSRRPTWSPPRSAPAC